MIAKIFIQKKQAAKLVLTLALSAILVGCVSLLPEPDPANDIYRLSAFENITLEEVVGADTVSQRLVFISPITAPKTLTGTDIIIMTNGNSIASVDKAQWIETIPKMLQFLLADSISNHEELTAILPSNRANSPYRLQVDLRKFEADFDQGDDQAPLAQVSFLATLVDTRTRNFIGQKTFTQTQRSNTRNVNAIVNAKSAVIEQSFNELAKWVASQTQ